MRSLEKWFVRLSGGRVLDAGCGRGRNARFLRLFGADIVCADKDPGALRAVLDPAYALWPPETDCSRCHAGGGKLIPLLADLAPYTWPFHPEAFNLIICVDFLDIRLMDAFDASLKRDGLLVIETVSRRGGNYLELPARDELRSRLGDRFELHIYQEIPAGPGGQDAVTARVLGVKK